MPTAVILNLISRTKVHFCCTLMLKNLACVVQVSVLRAVTINLKTHVTGRPCFNSVSNDFNFSKLLGNNQSENYVIVTWFFLNKSSFPKF